MYKTILFDLDGTITNSSLGITNSAIYALKKFGIEVTDRTELYKFIGPPLWESFEMFYGFSKEKSELAVKYFREYYSDKGIYENEVYAGIPELLDTLKKDGRQIALATSKSTVFAEKILEHFDLTQYFGHVIGSNMDGTRVKKSEVISYALELCSVTDKSTVIMIGDREHDIIGAKEVGINSVGILYGFGDRTEHENAGATYIAEDTAELCEMLLKM